MNHDTVDHVSAVVGPHLKSLLDGALRARPPPAALPALVGDLMRRTLKHVDDGLLTEFLALLPRDPDALARLDPARVRAVLNDKSGRAGGYRRTARAFGGSTALITLVDPTRAHLWVANVGDCVAGEWPDRLRLRPQGEPPGTGSRPAARDADTGRCFV